MFILKKILGVSSDLNFVNFIFNFLLFFLNMIIHRVHRQNFVIIFIFIFISGREDELMDKDKAQEMYFHVKCEVESCIAYLKDKREKDPYRNLFPRLLYQATHGFSSTVPTFDL